MCAASECDVAIEITFFSMPTFYLAVRTPNERIGLGVTHGAVLEFLVLARFLVEWLNTVLCLP